MATPSGYPTLIKACPTIQGQLKDHWELGDWPAIAEPMPQLTFLASRDNKRNINNAILPGKGKVRTVESTFIPRLSESLGSSNVANPLCTTGDTIGEESVTNTMDTTLNDSYAISITFEDMKAACDDPERYIRERLAMLIDWADRKTATRTATQAVALTGSWAQSIPHPFETPGTVNNLGQLIIETMVGPGKLDPLAPVILKNALNDSGFGMAYMFGGTAGRIWNQLLDSGCCSADGLDLGDIYAKFGQAYAYDMRVQTALGSQGSNEFMAIAPGMLQLLNYTKAENNFDEKANIIFGGLNENYAHIVVRSPVTGVLYDVAATNDCGLLTMRIYSTTKLIGLPSNMFVTGDNLRGVNGVFQVVIKNSYTS